MDVQKTLTILGELIHASKNKNNDLRQKSIVEDMELIYNKISEESSDVYKHVMRRLESNTCPDGVINSVEKYIEINNPNGKITSDYFNDYLKTFSNNNISKPLSMAQFHDKIKELGYETYRKFIDKEKRTLWRKK
jgi:predicted DNA-binding protein (UPF0278 family)